MSNNRNKAQDFLEWTNIGYSNRTWDGLTELLDEVESDAKHDVLELTQALGFFDKVQAASKEDRVAIGNDHWEWLESAARKVIGEEK